MALAFLQGWLVACCCVAGLFFVRFWRSTADRLFLFFAAGFFVFGLNWLGLAVLGGTSESRHVVYLLRLLAFGLILVGIWDKNRQEKRLRARPTSPLVGGASTGAAQRRAGQ